MSDDTDPTAHRSYHACAAAPLKKNQHLNDYGRYSAAAPPWLLQLPDYGVLPYTNKLNIFWGFFVKMSQESVEERRGEGNKQQLPKNIRSI